MRHSMHVTELRASLEGASMREAGRIEDENQKWVRAVTNRRERDLAPVILLASVVAHGVKDFPKRIPLNSDNGYGNGYVISYVENDEGNRIWKLNSLDYRLTLAPHANVPSLNSDHLMRCMLRALNADVNKASMDALSSRGFPNYLTDAEITTKLTNAFAEMPENIIQDIASNPLRHIYFLKMSKRPISVFLNAMHNNGISFNTSDEKGWNALHHASKWMMSFSEGLESHIEDMVKVGIPINQKNDNGNTPLMEMLRTGGCSSHILDTMLRLGADLNVSNTEGYTPLHVAVDNLISTREHGFNAERDKKVIDILIERGASPDIQNGRGETPVDLLQEFIDKDFLNNEQPEYVQEVLVSLREAQCKKPSGFGAL